MIQVVLFDLGDTLIYFDSDWPAVMTEANQVLVGALRQAGFSVDESLFLNEFIERGRVYREQRVTEMIEFTIEHLLQSLLKEHGYPDVPFERLRPILDRMYSVSQSHWVLEEDAHDTLAALRSQGYRLGLISNAAYERDVQLLIDREDLRNYFEVILVSAGTGYRKPHPRIFQEALRYFNVLPQEVAMVGDTLGADIIGAHHMAMVSVWVTRRANRPDNLAHENTIVPDITVSALSDIPDALLHWNSASTQ